MTSEEIKAKLEEEIAQTEAQILRLQELTKPISPNDAIGRVSRMDAINNKALMKIRYVRRKPNCLILNVYWRM
ncbi:hypothetical protein Q2T40_19295 [Winogradskyella maritima]|uniref:Uncharacterized protein n=1 Tax=Winogradskyella maritima TaxID=1517766 RepID=A0ABV8AHL5_9FLAO|nr:hypothetical protein [Winogradskyella maritima]